MSVVQLLVLCILAAQWSSVSALAKIVAARRAFSRSERPPHEDAFVNFVRQHGRSYAPNSEEYNRRLVLFSLRAHEVETHNSRSDRLWTAGINHLADWTEDELKTLRGWTGKHGSSGDGAVSRHGLSLNQRSKAVALPEEFMNWTSLSVLQHSPDQGGCGSCWAVASSSMLSAHVQIYRSAAVKFATQELLNCVPNERHCGGDGGCKGATIELAYDYILQHGLSPEDDVPYAARTMTCNHASSVLQHDSEDKSEPTRSSESVGMRSLGMMGWERLAENKYEPLMQALVERGPVAVSVAASSWNSYDGGIFNGCGKDAIIDHAVLLIGYGGSNQKKYWFIQNSWGPGWGEHGHIRLLRNDNEEEYCGTDNRPAEGTGCVGGPSEVKVCGMCGILYDTVVPHFKNLV